MSFANSWGGDSILISGSGLMEDQGRTGCAGVHWKLRWLVGVESMSDEASWLDLESVNTHSLSPFCWHHAAGPARAITGHSGERISWYIRSRQSSVFLCAQYDNKCEARCDVSKVSLMSSILKTPGPMTLHDTPWHSTPHYTGLRLSRAQNTAWANSFHILNFTLIGSWRLVTINFSLSIFCINMPSVKRRSPYIQATRAWVSDKSKIKAQLNFDIAWKL